MIAVGTIEATTVDHILRLVEAVIVEVTEVDLGAMRRTETGGSIIMNLVDARFYTENCRV